jgi:anamorsin
VGSSFPLKKATRALPKIQIDDDSDLIDEDNLLMTEEGLKKPQVPVGIATNPFNLVKLCKQ